MDNNVSKLVDILKNSTNATAKEMAKKKLAGLGLDENGNPIEQPKEEPKEEPKAKAKKEKKPKSDKKGVFGGVPKMQVSDDKQYITYKGKKYSIEECEDLFKAWNMKKKAAAKAVEKSESKSTTEKVLDKAETTIKQIVSDKAAKKKIKENPKQAKRELVKVQKTMRAWLDAVEEFLGKKIPESKIKRVFSLLEEIELMEDGGALTYDGVYDSNMDEFADGDERGKPVIHDIEKTPMYFNAHFVGHTPLGEKVFAELNKHGDIVDCFIGEDEGDHITWQGWYTGEYK